MGKKVVIIGNKLLILRRLKSNHNNLKPSPLMSAKIGILDELRTILTKKDTTDEVFSFFQNNSN